MRFIHTGDWHLGRLFHGVHLTDDQAHVLHQLVELVRETKPDVILVAGDVYDRAVPPPEAVELLDEILSRLVLDLQAPVIVIAGNHDSPNRLQFGSRVMAGTRLHITGQLPRKCEPLVLHDGHGPVHFFAVPYAEPPVVRQCLECDELPDHNAAMRATMDCLRAAREACGRSVLIAHAFVVGGAGCESERPLSVGGAGTVDAECFDGFNYVALGHLHCPQQLGDGRLRYCGSLLKYSFDEAAQAKSVYVVEMDGDGRCACETVSFSPRREVRRVQGLMSELLAGPRDAASREDYVEVLLTDPGPVLDPAGRLRDLFPNLLNIRFPERELLAATGDRPQIKGLDEKALFKAFYTHVQGNDLAPEHESAFVAIVEQMRQKQREAACG
jgi:exonuclease SbcD